MGASRIRPHRGSRRIAPALLLSVVLVMLALPVRATASSAHVTVKINGVGTISGGDPGNPPDFFTRIWIGNGGFFQSTPVADSNSPSTAGWTYSVSTSTAWWAGGRVPIRIELWDDDSPFPAQQFDIDPGACSGCNPASSGRPPNAPADSLGLDLTTGINPLPGNPARFTGVDSATGGDAMGTDGLPTCVAGSEFPSVALICFTITVTRTPETLTVTKLADTDDGVCLPSDCSLRDAVNTAGPGDTIILPDLGGPYRLTSGAPAPIAGTLGNTQAPGHLQIRQPKLTILGPPHGAIIQQTLQFTRVFDINQDAGLDLRNVTLTGGSAASGSTAASGHLHGGAIHNHGTLNLVNVTITGNHAVFCSASALCGGGGIYNALTGVATLTNVTIADNDASVDAGGLAGTPMTLHNVLIVDNTGGTTGGNCDKPEIDDGGNLQYPAGVCGVPVATRNPIGPLTDGVYRLPAGSEAIDHGTLGGHTVHTFKHEHFPTRCPSGDQIGTPRPLDGDGDGIARCDSGAIEFPPTGHDVVHRPIGFPGRLHPVTLIFDTIARAGTSTLRIVRARPDDAPPKGFRAGKPARYYDLATTAAYRGRIRVCVRYRRQTFGGASALRLFQFTKRRWIDRTVALGTRPRRVCGRSPSLGRYAVFARIRPARA